MRFPLFSTLIFTCATSLTAVQAQEGLFTEIRADAVFRDAQPGTSQTRPNAGDDSRSLPGNDALREMLSVAGYAPKALENSLAIDVQGENWNSQLILELQNDRSELLLSIRLADRVDPNQLTKERLLKLMQLNASQTAATFLLSEKADQLSVRVRVENRDMSVNRLRNAIENLRTLADNQRDAWQFNKPLVAATPPKAEGPPAAAPPANAPANAPAPAATAAASPLVGKWVGSRQNEAFALQVSAAGEFQLAFITQGKNRKLQGSLTLQGDQLTLAGTDGTKLTGTIKLADGKLDFTLPAANNGTTVLNFRKAN